MEQPIWNFLPSDCTDFETGIFRYGNFKWYECMEQLHVAITGYTFFQQIYVNNRFEYTD